MREQLLQTYNDLFQSLNELPNLIADINDQLAKAKEGQSATQKRLASLEADIVSKYGGWKELGKNETERKYGLARLLAIDPDYQRVQQSLDAYNQEITELTNQLDALTRQYGAVCYQTRLHAALFNYLGSAGAPVTSHANGNGNAVQVDASDAETIGL